MDGTLVDTGEPVIGVQGRLQRQRVARLRGRDPSPQPRACNDLDDDCDGSTDETTKLDCVADGDGDGFGAGPTLSVCGAAGACPPGFVSPGGATDCDDDSDTVFPGAAEVCNGEDDDCDATPDDAFPCVQGETVLGPGVCDASREGSRRCSASCAWVDPGFVVPETGGTCDYCDDTLTGIAAEVGLANEVFRYDFFRDDVTFLGEARGFLEQSGMQLVSGAATEFGGIYYGPVQVGHGTITFRAEIEVMSPSGEGFSVNVLEGATPESALLYEGGRIGSPLPVTGAPIEADGFGVTWQYYTPAGRTGETEVDIRRLMRYRARDTDAIVAGETPVVEVASGGRQLVELVITPDTIGTPANETTVEVRVIGLIGMGSEAEVESSLSCGPGKSRACAGITVTPGQSYWFGMTAGTSRDRQAQIWLDGEFGATESFSFVEIEKLCL